MIVILAVAACGSGDDGPPDIDPGPRELACAESELVGTFEIALAEQFTSVQGKVVDAVDPRLISVLTDSVGDCQLRVPPTLFCDPTCGADTTCNADAMCVPTSRGLSVGTVFVAGLKAPVSMTASSPVYFYTNLDPLDHPGFDEGDEIVLIAYNGDVDDFALGGSGIVALSGLASSVPLDRDQPISLSWDPPGQQGLGMILLDLNIAQHGGTPGRIECLVDDTGQFEIPVSLTNQLLDFGFSGFPSLSITRRSADSTTTGVGCVELIVQSQVVLEIEIPGLTSCSKNEDCPPGENCLGDLTCG